MRPSHSEGLHAARRVRAAVEAGDLTDARDAIVMLTYHMSLEVRRLPENERMSIILRAARDMIANTRESLD